MSKHCGYPQAWPIIRPLLFWAGDIIKLPPPQDDEGVACDGGECQRYNSPGSIHDVIHPVPIVPHTFHDQGTQPKAVGEDDTHGTGRVQSYRNALRSPHVI